MSEASAREDLNNWAWIEPLQAAVIWRHLRSYVWPPRAEMTWRLGFSDFVNQSSHTGLPTWLELTQNMGPLGSWASAMVALGLGMCILVKKTEALWPFVIKPWKSYSVSSSILSWSNLSWGHPDSRGEHTSSFDGGGARQRFWPCL